MLGMGAIGSDEELAAATPAFEPLIRVERQSVQTLGKLGGVTSRVLRHVERGDLAIAVALFEEHGIEFVLTAAGIKLMPQKPS